MGDLEHARLTLQAARKDLKALAVMTDPHTVDLEIFGFHAQQAAEKALKAWLCVIGVEYPRIHDLEALCIMLEERKQDIPSAFRRLDYLTDFAVEFRYTAFGDLRDDVDRQQVIRDVTQLLEHVERMLPSIAPPR